MINFPTCFPWSRNFHNLSWLRGAGNVKEDVVITGVHVRGLKDGASQQSCVALRDLQQHVGDKKRRHVILGEDLDGELVPGLMMTVSDAKDYEVFGGVTVVMVIADHSPFYVIDSKHEALSTWNHIKQLQSNRYRYRQHPNQDVSANMTKWWRVKLCTGQIPLWGSNHWLGDNTVPTDSSRQTKQEMQQCFHNFICSTKWTKRWHQTIFEHQLSPA